MKIQVSKLLGDAAVSFYNKNGELIYTEFFFGNGDSRYERVVPVAEVEYSHTTALFDKQFEYKVVV